MRSNKNSNLDSNETKDIAVRLVEVEGRSPWGVAKNLGISSNELANFLERKTFAKYWTINDKSRLDAVEGAPYGTPNGLNYENIRRDVHSMAVDGGELPDAIAAIVGLTLSKVTSFLSRESQHEFWSEYDYDADWEINYWGKVLEIDSEETEPEFNGTMDEPIYADCHGDGGDAPTKFILMTAQNNAHVDGNFLDAIESYADKNNAKIMVSPVIYHPNGILGVKTEVKYDPRIENYLVDEATRLSHYCGGLIFCAELNIIPTAVNPISSMHTYCKTASGIIPHAKLQMESVPTHKEDKCRMLYTTGSITQRLYPVNKAGQKAAFHHVFSALVVEIDHDNECWYVRQLCSAHDGSFQDLNHQYNPDGTVVEAGVEAINWGDIHSEKCEEEIVELNYGKGGILDSLRPKFQFAHDLSDFTPRNHHNRKDPHFLYRTSISECQTVEEGLNVSADMLKVMSRDWCKTVVVNSNHDNALEKWLKEADYRLDPVNAVFFLTAQLACYEAITNAQDGFSIFETALTEIVDRNISLVDHNVQFLRLDESFKICTGNSHDSAIECGYHGHTGNNGSRGSVSTYQKLGNKANIGHSHSATIKDGVYQAGVSGSLDMGYNVGGSSWSHSHILTYANGKRAMITTHGNSWKL